MTEDTREQLAMHLEWLAAQVREHGVLPGWEADSRADGVKVPSGRFLNWEPTGRFTHTVKCDIDRSTAWAKEELNRV